MWSLEGPVNIIKGHNKRKIDIWFVLRQDNHEGHNKMKRIKKEEEKHS